MNFNTAGGLMFYADFARISFLNMVEVLDRLVERALEAALSDDVLAAKLTDDMFPLELQFRVALNQVLLALRQVGNQDVPLEETAYTSWTNIRVRIAAIRELIEAAEPADWADADAMIDLTLPNGVHFVMSAEADIRDWILPNFYFHVTMAYAILRQAGLSIGKMDFLPHMARHRINA